MDGPSYGKAMSDGLVTMLVIVAIGGAVAGIIGLKVISWLWNHIHVSQII